MRVLLFLGVALIGIFLLYQGGAMLEKHLQKPEPRGDYERRQVLDTLVNYEGKSYALRKGLTSILLLGIDAEETPNGLKGFRNGGRADFLLLLVLDEKQKEVTRIQIDRDTITPITVLGVLGNHSGKRNAQISLSHGFGDGKEMSAELTVNALSEFLGNFPIDFYVAMNMSGIPVLNDAVGGVPITLTEDFTAFDPAMAKGATLTLNGTQAEFYVRGRMSVGAGTNEARMQRQEEYVSKLSSMLATMMSSNQNFVNTLYEDLTPYLVTNLSKGRLAKETWAAKDYLQPSPIKPKGRHEVSSNGFMQFFAEEASLQKTLVDLYYEPMVQPSIQKK